MVQIRPYSGCWWPKSCSSPKAVTSFLSSQPVSCWVPLRLYLGPRQGKKRGHCCHPNFWRWTIKCVWNYQPNNSGPQGSSNCSKENHSVPTTTRTSISLDHWKSPTFPTSQVLPSQTYPRKYIHPQYYVQFLLKKSSLILWFCLKIWYPPIS